MKKVSNRTEVCLHKEKLIHLIPSLNIIAQAWGLKLSRTKDFMVAKRILINSVKKN